MKYGIIGVTYLVMASIFINIVTMVYRMLRNEKH